MAMFYSAEDVLKVMSDEDSNSDCYDDSDDSVTSESDGEYAVEYNILFEELLSAGSSEEHNMLEWEDFVPEFEGAHISSPRGRRGLESLDSHAPSQSSEHSSRGRGEMSPGHGQSTGRGRGRRGTGRRQQKKNVDYQKNFFSTLCV